MTKKLFFSWILTAWVATTLAATFTLQKTIVGGQLTPLCLPVEVTTTHFDELFAVGGIDDNGQAVLYPVARVEAGVPFVARCTETRSLTEIADVTPVTSAPAEIPLVWQGGSVQGEYGSYTWHYTTVLGSLGLASQLTFTFQDLQSMDFDVTLENLSVRRYFAQTRYDFSRTSQIQRFNNGLLARPDEPNPVTLPIPATATGEVTVSVGSTEGAADVAVVSSDAASGVCQVYNLIPQRTYYFRMEAAGTTVSQGKFHTQGHLRMIYVPSISNVRDLGGWPTYDGRRIRYGRIFRGGELDGTNNKMPPSNQADIQTMKALGVTAEIDLRWTGREGDYTGMSAYDFSEADSTFYFVDGDDYAGSHLDRPETREHYQRSFNMIVNTLRNGGGIYFHCVWGADRTGLFALVLEAILGVTPDAFFKDYELTSFSIAGLRSKNNFSGQPKYFDAYAGSTISERAANYLRTRLGISQEDIDYFRDTMLE